MKTFKEKPILEEAGLTPDADTVVPYAMYHTDTLPNLGENCYRFCLPITSIKQRRILYSFGYGTGVARKASRKACSS